MTDDVLSAEQVAEIAKNSFTRSNAADVAALCHSHEALRERLRRLEEVEQAARALRAEIRERAELEEPFPRLGAALAALDEGEGERGASLR